MKDFAGIPEAICPRCGNTYRAPSALSRADNRTPICPECGIRESLESIGCDKEAQDHILALIREYEITREVDGERRAGADD